MYIVFPYVYLIDKKVKINKIANEKWKKKQQQQQKNKKRIKEKIKKLCIHKSKLIPNAINLKLVWSWGKQTNAFDKSAKTAANVLS